MREVQGPQNRAQVSEARAYKRRRTKQRRPLHVSLPQVTVQALNDDQNIRLSHRTARDGWQPNGKGYCIPMRSCIYSVLLNKPGTLERSQWRATSIEISKVHTRMSLYTPENNLGKQLYLFCSAPSLLRLGFLTCFLSFSCMCTARVSLASAGEVSPWVAQRAV